VLAAICVAALVLGTVAAMVVTQRLRKEGPIATDIRLKTKPDEYRVCFRMPRDDTVDVAMVGSSGQVVRALASGAELDGGPRGEDNGKRTAHCFDWDGRDETGAAVPPGLYRLQLSLAEADRVAISGEKLRIDAPGQS
jgi:flagellar hook assembly protein FlgD